jgi:hypothetical protein
MIQTQLEIACICDDIKNLLLGKNAKYGDAAINPIRIFSQASPVEQILVRIDDKLSRISKGAGLVANDEDVINDLIGYLVLLKIAQRREHWDGTDIEPVPPAVNALGAITDELWNLHASGDRFG